MHIFSFKHVTFLDNNGNVPCGRSFGDFFYHFYTNEYNLNDTKVYINIPEDELIIIRLKHPEVYESLMWFKKK